MGNGGQGMVKCDICNQTITADFPIHSCQPTVDNLIRLIPNYKNMPTDEQARWITSTLHALNSSHKPNWYDGHKAVVEDLVERYGVHLKE